ADDLNIPKVEEIDYSDADEGVGAEVDMTNLDTHILVSLILLPIKIHTTRDMIRRSGRIEQMFSHII
ncbi:hypothetical protein Tco_0334598, partial [Tanacetum coccineum]